MAIDLTDGVLHQTNWIYSCYDAHTNEQTDMDQTRWNNSNTGIGGYGWYIKSLNTNDWVCSYNGRSWLKVQQDLSTGTLKLEYHVEVKTPGEDSTKWHSNCLYTFYDINDNKLSSGWFPSNKETSVTIHSRNTVYTLTDLIESLSIPDNATSIKCYPYWWCGTFDSEYGGSNYSGGRIYWYNDDEYQFIVNNACAWIYNGTEWKQAIPYIYNGTAWVRATPYIYNGTSWKQGKS